MLQYVAIDLDGTLLNSKHQISDRTRKVIVELQLQGIQFLLASGRPYLSVLPFAQQLGLTSPLITTNGSYIKSAHTEKIFYRQGLSLALAQELIEYGWKKDFLMSLYYEEELITFNQEMVKKIYDLEQIRAHYSVDREIQRAPLKIVFCDQAEKILQGYEQAQQEFGDRLYISQSADIYLEFMETSASKGRALAVLQEKLKWDRLLAIGNHYNDLTMFEVADLSVAMGDSPDAVQRKADWVTESNDLEGVANFLEEYFM